MKRAAQSIGAIVVGYLVFGVASAILFAVSGQDPRATPSAAFMIGSTLYGALFAGLGGYLAARLAPRAPGRHGQVVAMFIAAGAAAAMAAEWRSGSIWSQLVVIVFAAPAAVIGGWWLTTSVPGR